MAGKTGGKGSGKGSVIIRREEVVGGGHHGGAWKVAYADFVTAMMAFFLLMWLLNATTEEQRKGLADYFSPTNVFSHSAAGSGQPFGGHTPFDDGELVSDRGAETIMPGKAPAVQNPDEADTDTPAGERVASGLADAGHLATGRLRAGQQSSGLQKSGKLAAGAAPTGQKNAGAADAKALAAALQAREQQAFDKAAQELRQALAANPAVSDLGRQLAIDMTPDGMRIQIIDEDHRPMFDNGSEAPNARAVLLLRQIAPVLQNLTENIAISGYTDAAPYHNGTQSNWELSADRANATRRALVADGLPETRIQDVSGHADRDPLLPADPLAAANRRIAITVLRAAPPVAPPAAAMR